MCSYVILIHKSDIDIYYTVAIYSYLIFHKSWQGTNIFVLRTLKYQLPPRYQFLLALLSKMSENYCLKRTDQVISKVCTSHSHTAVKKKEGHFQFYQKSQCKPIYMKILRILVPSQILVTSKKIRQFLALKHNQLSIIPKILHKRVF